LEARRGAGAVAGAIAGVVLGTVMFVRIDSLALLVAIPAALVVEWLRADRLDPLARRRRHGAIVTFAASTFVSGWLGLRVTGHQSPSYYRALQHNLHMLELALVAGVLAAIAVFVGHRLFRGVGARLARNNLPLMIGVAAVVMVSFYAYKIRPKSGSGPPHLSLAEPPAERIATRRAFNSYFASASFRWFAWYLGTVMLVLIVIGFMVLTVRALRSDSPAFMLLAAAGPVTLLYVGRPSISPDQLWAMRRYLPMVLPVMTIAAAAAAACCIALLAGRLPMWRAPATVVLVALMVLPAANAGRPIARAQMQRGALAAVHHICRTVGPNGALAIEPEGLLAITLPQAVRGFCGVPASGVKRNPVRPVGSDLREWEKQGRTLYVAAANEHPAVAPGVKTTQVAHLTIDDATEPARVFGHRPASYVPRPAEIWLYRVQRT
jgi:hypothetical protein